jgi:hypothetical protein
MPHGNDLLLTMKGVEFTGLERRARTLMSGSPVRERAACIDRYGNWKDDAELAGGIEFDREHHGVRMKAARIVDRNQCKKT